MTNQTLTLDEIKKLNDHSILSYILLVFIFVFQFSSKARDVQLKVNEEEIKIGNELFWKFLIISQLSKAVQWCMTPYYFDFFSIFHKMNYNNFARLVFISYLSSSILGMIFIGYLNDKKNKKIPCLIYGILMIICCITRLMDNYNVLIFSQIILGISTSILNSSFENWFINECLINLTDKNTRESIMTNAFEKNIICDSITAMFVNFYLGKIKKQKYGMSLICISSISISLIQLIIVQILINSDSFLFNDDKKEKMKNDKINKIEEININDSLIKHTFKSINAMSRNKFYFFIGITESLIYITTHLFITLWKSTLKSVNPHLNLQNIFTLFMIAFMVGGTFFRVLYAYCKSDILKISKSIGFFLILGFYLINFGFTYDNKIHGFIFYEISIGLFYPIYSVIKANCIDDNYRGSFYILFRIPSYIFNGILYLYIKTWEVSQIRLTCFYISIFIFLFQLFYFYQPEDKNKEENNNKVKENNKKKIN